MFKSTERNTYKLSLLGLRLTRLAAYNIIVEGEQSTLVKKIKQPLRRATTHRLDTSMHHAVSTLEDSDKQACQRVNLAMRRQQSTGTKPHTTLSTTRKKQHRPKVCMCGPLIAWVITGSHLAHRNHVGLESTVLLCAPLPFQVRLPFVSLSVSLSLLLSLSTSRKT